MFSERDLAVKLAQHQDRLNRVEKRRLMEQVAGSNEDSPVWQHIGNLVVGLNRRRGSARNQTNLAQKGV